MPGLAFSPIRKAPRWPCVWARPMSAWRALGVTHPPQVDAVRAALPPLRGVGRPAAVSLDRWATARVNLRYNSTGVTMVLILSCGETGSPWN